MPPKAAEKKPTTAGKAPAGKAPEKKVCLLLFSLFFLLFHSHPFFPSWFKFLIFQIFGLYNLNIILTRFVTPPLGSRKEDCRRWWREEEAHQDQKGDLLFLYLQGFVQSRFIRLRPLLQSNAFFLLQFWSRFTPTLVSPTVPCLFWTLSSTVCFFQSRFLQIKYFVNYVF